LIVLDGSHLLTLIAPGDREHIPNASRPIYEILGAELQRVKAKAPSQYKAHVTDTEKRLNILFDHLNNEDLLKPDTIQQMNELAGNIQAKQYDDAIAIFQDLMTKCYTQLNFECAKLIR
jgi:protein transport protein SEC31